MFDWINLSLKYKDFAKFMRDFIQNQFWKRNDFSDVSLGLKPLTYRKPNFGNYHDFIM